MPKRSNFRSYAWQALWSNWHKANDYYHCKKNLSILKQWSLCYSKRTNGKSVSLEKHNGTTWGLRNSKFDGEKNVIKCEYAYTLTHKCHIAHQTPIIYSRKYRRNAVILPRTHRLKTCLARSSEIEKDGMNQKMYKWSLRLQFLFHALRFSVFINMPPTKPSKQN